MLQFDLTKALPRTVLAAGLTAALALGVQAAPRFADAKMTIDSSSQPYALQCWQNGVKVFDEQGINIIASLEILETPGVTFRHADGSQRTLLAFDESLCILERD